MRAFPRLIDSTMLVAWRACNRKWELEFGENLAPDGKSVDLHFGGAVAAGLEAARKAFYLEGKSEAEANNIGLNAALIYWGNFQAPDGHAKNGNSLLLALDGYYRQWPFSSDPLKPMIFSPDKAGIEFTFACPTPVEHPDGGHIAYGGRFDMLGILEGVNHIVDEKTTGRGFSSNWSQSWNFRNQFIGYVWGCHNYGIPVAHVLVRGLSILKTKMDFTQAIVTVPDHIIERWYNQVIRDLTMMVQQWKQGYFDLNIGDTCSSYGNCPFLPVCTAQTPSEWYTMYSERNWDPLKKNPTEKEVAARSAA